MPPMTSSPPMPERTTRFRFEERQSLNCLPAFEGLPLPELGVASKRSLSNFHGSNLSERLLPWKLESDRFEATPNSGSGNPSKAGRQFNDCLSSNRNRVVLSGIGGDEVMGGIPTPTPELQ